MRATTTLATLFVAALAFVAAPFGCGIDSLPTSQQTGAACDATHPCAVVDPTCQKATCSAEGTCELENLTPTLLDPTPNDCHAIRCVDGARTTYVDDTDHEPSGPCADFSCHAGKPATKLHPVGAACEEFGGVGKCDDKGACVVGCVADTDCKQTNPCQVPFCDTAISECAAQRLDGVHTPHAAQPKGDCAQQVCVDGVDAKVIDLTDIPALPKDNGCFTTSCTADGVPTITQAEPRAACSSPAGGVYCDAAGDCVACTLDADCATTQHDDCQTPVCGGAHTCVLKSIAEGTVVATQTPGDCEQVVCNGNGGTKQIPLNTDLPSVDSCHTAACLSGAPKITAKPDGAACGNGHQCFSGACGCTTNADCPNLPNELCDMTAGSPTFGTCQCTPATCAGKTCGPLDDGCGHTLDCDDHIADGTETDIDCGGGGGCSPCAAGLKCIANSDCANSQCVDGYCCNKDAAHCGGCFACSIQARGGGATANGTCAPVLAGGGASRSACATSSQTSCGTDGTCDGTGKCRDYVTTTVCGTSCAVNELTTKVCNGAGACTTGAPTTCPNDFACSNGACATSCSDNTTCATGFVCGVGGQCLLPNGAACGSASVCATGNCAQGVCCGTPCGTCSACDGSPPGSTKGTCAPEPQDTSCGTNQSCDGRGNCLASDGQGCSSDASCADGHCAGDGLCCRATCGVCHTCADGATCSAVAAGSTQAGCGSTAGCGTPPCACDATATCVSVGALGAGCTGDTTCASLHCSTEDRLCCSSACGVCSTCAGGTCTSVADSQTTTSCTGTTGCSGPNCECNGSGSCTPH